jgi:hypothetical protein
VQQHQSVQEIAEEALERQAKSLAQRRGLSLEDARQAVSDTEAGRQLRVLANGEHHHEKASECSTIRTLRRNSQALGDEPPLPPMLLL